MNWWRLAVVVAVVLAIVQFCSGVPPDPPTRAEPPLPDTAQARGACLLFVPRAYPDADFVDSGAWTVIDNRDGSFSVGARYYEPTSQGRRLRYTTCIVRRVGNEWKLERMARLL